MAATAQKLDKPAEVPVAPVAPAPVAAKPVPQTLRQAQPRKFGPNALQPLGYGSLEILAIEAPADWVFEDVLRPIAWANVAARVAKDPLNTQQDRIGSLIYLRAKDYTAWLSIEAITKDHLGHPNGLNVQCIGPSINLKTGEPCPLDNKTRLPWVDPVKAE